MNAKHENEKSCIPLLQQFLPRYLRQIGRLVFLRRAFPWVDKGPSPNYRLMQVAIAE